MIKEGETLKENENVQADLPEESENIGEMLVSVQEKWDALQNDIKDKNSRYFTMIGKSAFAVFFNFLKSSNKTTQSLTILLLILGHYNVNLD